MRNKEIAYSWTRGLYQSNRRAGGMFFFLPVGTTRPCWRVPYVTYWLIAANIIVYAIQVRFADTIPDGFVPAEPNPFMWVAAMFMHGDVFHLAGNMLFLWLFATLTEDIFGPLVLVGFYFAANLGATLLHVAAGRMFTPADLSIPVVGASGAIAGIMGLSAVCFLKTKVRVWYLIGLLLFWRAGAAEIAAPVFLGLWVGWEVVQGTIVTALQAHDAVGGGGVAHWAHVGGFAVGIGGGLVLGLRDRAFRTDLVEGRNPAVDDHEVYEQTGDLEQLVTQRPEDADAWQALGRTRERTPTGAMASEAYGKALELFLKERRGTKAVEAWAALKGQQMPEMPDALRFQLACALDECGHRQDAFLMFRDLSLVGETGPHSEAALVRAAEIARLLPEYREQAAMYYQRLLQEFPYSSWRGLVLERLKELGVKQELPGARAADEPQSAPLDPYGMGAVTSAGAREEP
jgi:membrane associated rhomboid family serine protease